MSCNGSGKLYIEKELSGLAFNERVLQEAAYKGKPRSAYAFFRHLFQQSGRALQGSLR
ncbi:hypothetical protein ACNKHO_15750 [Shigella flexneri]